MALEEQPTFYLYSIGHPPNQLSLGHVVLKDYANPLLARNIRAPEITEDQIREWADITPANCAFETASEGNFAVGLEVPVAGEVSVRFSGTMNKVVTARAGRRVMLKDASRFFDDVVAKNQDVRAKLAVWCTVASSRYMLHKALLGLRRPQIWLLTGFYEFEGGSLSELHHREPGAELGIGAELMTALSGVPVGGSIGVGGSRLVRRQVEMPETRIWAAQWQRLDTQWIRQPASRDTDTDAAVALIQTQLQVQLLPDTTYSKGVMLGSSEHESGRIVAAGFSLGDLGSRDDIIEQDEEYAEAFAVAERRLTRQRAS